MSRARRKHTDQPPLLIAASDVVGIEQTAVIPNHAATTVSTGGPIVASLIVTETVPVPVLTQASQLDKANALAHAREAGEREGIIATFCECAAIARDWNVGNDETRLGRRIANDIIAEVCRRYGADNERVRYHLRLRGLQP